MTDFLLLLSLLTLAISFAAAALLRGMVRLIQQFVATRTTAGQGRGLAHPFTAVRNG
ncbi:hypothetical protein [Variovorax sp.]|uniref:hypothetical protein n=1 Tax=Variovorax sp. TaxID=1871043 RepID=UPI002D2C1AD9|nr:hypothetical protein [Variovorax sp.]HYP85371.1 hypothetical protein [Variovorax sp.]